NIASGLRYLLGAALMRALGVTATDFTHLPLLLALCSGALLLPLPLLLLVPGRLDTDEGAAEAAAEAPIARIASASRPHARHAQHGAEHGGHAGHEEAGGELAEGENEAEAERRGLLAGPGPKGGSSPIGVSPRVRVSGGGGWRGGRVSGGGGSGGGAPPAAVGQGASPRGVELLEVRRHGGSGGGAAEGSQAGGPAWGAGAHYAAGEGGGDEEEGGGVGAEKRGLLAGPGPGWAQ
ncbi:hypothetical protein HYH03_010925, partial [Edaphochlamys debaryana]